MNNHLWLLSQENNTILWSTNKNFTEHTDHLSFNEVTGSIGKNIIDGGAWLKVYNNGSLIYTSTNKSGSSKILWSWVYDCNCVLKKCKI